MPFSFLQQKGNLAEFARELTLSTYVPHIALDGLVRGVDNVRHDVFLSSKFSEVPRQQFCRRGKKSGSGQAVAGEEAGAPARRRSLPRTPGAPKKSQPYNPADSGEFKRMLVEIHVAALN